MEKLTIFFKRQMITQISYLQHQTIENPFNIQPLGNQYLKSENDTRQHLGYFQLPDELIIKLMVKIGPFNTIKLSRTCKALYIFGYHDDLWRHFTTKLPEIDYNFNWRFTFKLFHKNDSIKDIPIKINGFYSDLLYSYWRCTQCDLNQLCNPTISNIDKRSNLSFQEFKRDYLEPGKPCIITDLVHNWKAYHKWDFEYFLNHDGKRLYQAEEARMTFKQYFSYLLECNEESPLYLFDKEMDNLQDYTVPEYFSDDLFSVLDNRPDFRWLIIGPKRSGSTFHQDPNSTSAWNAVIRGSKKWIIYPPHVVPPGVFPSRDGSQVTTPISITEWFMNYYSQTPIKPFEATVNEGELIFIPSRWWHSVINLEDSIAITQNFVSKEILLQVLKFLKYKKDQVSGYHSGDLYADFKQELKRKRPDLIDIIDSFENEPLKKRKWDELVQNETFQFQFNNKIINH
jgi:hypothetical protein